MASPESCSNLSKNRQVYTETLFFPWFVKAHYKTFDFYCHVLREVSTRHFYNFGNPLIYEAINIWCVDYSETGWPMLYYLQSYSLFDGRNSYLVSASFTAYIFPWNDFKSCRLYSYYLEMYTWFFFLTKLWALLTETLCLQLLPTLSDFFFITKAFLPWRGWTWHFSISLC